MCGPLMLCRRPRCFVRAARPGEPLLCAAAGRAGGAAEGGQGRGEGEGCGGEVGEGGETRERGTRVLGAWTCLGKGGRGGSEYMGALGLWSRGARWTGSAQQQHIPQPVCNNNNTYPHPPPVPGPFAAFSTEEGGPALRHTSHPSSQLPHPHPVPTDLQQQPAQEGPSGAGRGGGQGGGCGQEGGCDRRVRVFSQ